MATRQIGGWVWPDKLQLALQYVSMWVGYPFDDSDWQAIEHGLHDTTAEHPQRWYDYPIVGTPSLTVLIARNPGADPIDVKVQGDIDDILAAKIDTLLSVLAKTTPQRH